MQAGIVEVNLHGMHVRQAQACIDSHLRKAGRSVYRLRLIHGYQGGTQLRDMIRGGYKNHPKVLRLEIGMNPGVTDLVLREL